MRPPARNVAMYLALSVVAVPACQTFLEFDPGESPEGGPAADAAGDAVDTSDATSDSNAGAIDAGAANDAVALDATPEPTPLTPPPAAQNYGQGFFDYVVPTPCGAINVLAWAAGGGAASGNVRGAGGAGGAAQARISVDAGETLHVVVGAPGVSDSAPGNNAGPGAAPDATLRGGGGGGLTMIYRFPANPEDQYAVVVGGGGGGAASSGPVAAENGLAGGGFEGEISTSASQATGGSGTQTAGGIGGGGGATAAKLSGGDGVGVAASAAGGGGGAGWFGGGGGGASGGSAGGGGGGSGYLGKTVIDGWLYVGQGVLPGNAQHAARGDAGAPQVGGRLIVWCD